MAAGSMSLPSFLRSVPYASRVALTVKLRGRLRRQAALRSNEAHQAAPKRPEGRRVRTISPSARGAKQKAHHGPLQRLLDVTPTTPGWPKGPVPRSQ